MKNLKLKKLTAVFISFFLVICVFNSAQANEKGGEKGTDIIENDKKDGNTAFYATYYGNDDVSDISIEIDKSKKNVPNKKTNFLTNQTKKIEATIKYQDEIGWTLKTKKHFFVFDYWQRKEVSENPNINNGTIDPKENSCQNILFFSFIIKI